MSLTRFHAHGSEAAMVNDSCVAPGRGLREFSCGIETRSFHHDVDIPNPAAKKEIPNRSTDEVNRKLPLFRSA